MIRIYDLSSGLRVFTANLSIASLAVGATATALADSTWLPAHEGQFTASGEVTCDGDSVPANNYLGNTPFTVTAPPPPPPPPPATHAETHEAGGGDELDLSGMSGVLADPQPTGAHAANHEHGGQDELSVQGLHGVLADPQSIAAHGNELHNLPFATSTQLATHNTADDAHANSTNLEKVARKGAASGYAPLNAQSKVPAVNLGGDPPSGGLFLRSDLSWQTAGAASLGSQPLDFTINDSVLHLLLTAPIIPAIGASIVPGLRLRVNVAGGFDLHVITDGCHIITAFGPPGAEAVLQDCLIPLPPMANAQEFIFKGEMHFGLRGVNREVWIMSSVIRSPFGFSDLAQAQARDVPLQWLPDTNYNLKVYAQIAPNTGGSLMSIALCDVEVIANITP